MKSQNSDLGQHLRGLRKEKGETLHQVSKGTDIDSPMLSKIERGDRMPTLEQLKRLCRYFKVSETDLKVMHTAEKIIKDYGMNETTYEAVRMVEEQLTPYLKKNKSK
ncbi:MAG: helix-turn-helix transcriptional regulator [Bacteroidia bacterium]|jgi:transcriptional regulator with XRE-family HTH domain